MERTTWSAWPLDQRPNAAFERGNGPMQRSNGEATPLCRNQRRRSSVLFIIGVSLSV